MVESGPSGHPRRQTIEVHGDFPLAAVRVSPGAAQNQEASSQRDVQLRGVRTLPEHLTSLTALPAFVSLVPVRLPFPPQPPRPPRPALADRHASNPSETPDSRPHKQGSKQLASRVMSDKKIHLSCEAWLQTPASRRLFTGERV